ncbi:hypothetical protein JHK87_032037 [Glycine soja]|nr:hypothetical protein JHK87_032037 [Glycine soja]
MSISEESNQLIQQQISRRHTTRQLSDIMQTRSEVGDEGQLWKEISQEVYKDADKLFKMIGEAYTVLSDTAQVPNYLEEHIHNVELKLEGMEDLQEESLFEAKKIQGETIDENNRMSTSIEELQVALQDAQKNIITLETEIRELEEKLDTANKNSRISSQKDEYWLENKVRSQLETQSSLNVQGNNSTILEDISTEICPHDPHDDDNGFNDNNVNAIRGRVNRCSGRCANRLMVSE